MFKRLFQSSQNAFTPNAFTLAEAMVSLGLTGVLISITIPIMLSSVQNSNEDANKARIKRMQVELSNGMSRYRRENDVNAATARNVMDNMTFSRRYTSGTITLDAPPLNEVNASGTTSTFTLLEEGTHAYTLPFGGTLIAFSQAFSNTAFEDCANPELRAMRFLYDPDSRASGSNDSVFLYVYDDDRVRTLGTLVPNTCTQTATSQLRVLGADPKGFND